MPNLSSRAKTMADRRRDKRAIRISFPRHMGSWSELPDAHNKQWASMKRDTLHGTYQILPVVDDGGIGNAKV